MPLLFIKRVIVSSPQDVRNYCKGYIAKYKIPHYVFVVDGFPMKGGGKIQKFHLIEMPLDLCEKHGIEIR